MAFFGALLCCSMLTVARANYHGNGCPFLKKVVPEGQKYMDMATNMMRLRATDCESFAGLFKEHGSFDFLQHTMTTQAEVEKMCNEREPQHALVPVLLEDSLKSVFPAFSTSDMLIEVQGPGPTCSFSTSTCSFLTHMHFDSKTNTVSQLKMLESAYAVESRFFEAGNKFLNQVYENYDCSVYDDMVLSNAVVQFNGEPQRFTQGLETVFKSAALAKSACEYKARTEKRIHTQNTVTPRTYYWDDSTQELTIMADRNVAVTFKPGVVRTRQMAVTLKFSEAGKITAIRTYETEVKHLEEKYGQPQSQGHSRKPREDGAKGGGPVVWASEMGVSAAKGAISMHWPQMLLAVLSVSLARV